MLKRLKVPTRLSKDLLSKYFNEDTCYLNLPNKIKKKSEPHFSNVLCKFFLKDNCTRGNNCLFSHDPSQFKCNDFKTYGICDADNCKFRHYIGDDAGVDNRHDDIKETTDSVEERPPFISPFS